MSDGGAATKLREVVADIHITADAHKPVPGLLLDAHGDVIKKDTLMARIDAKSVEPITLSKGTIIAIAVIPAVLTLLFTYGAAAFGWVRDDQSQKLEIQQLRSDVTDMKKTLEKMQDAAQSQAVSDAKKAGYELGAIDGTTGHASMKKK